MTDSLRLKALHLGLIMRVMTRLSVSSCIIKLCSMMFLLSFAVIDTRSSIVCFSYLSGFYVMWMADGYLVSVSKSYRRLYEEVRRGGFDGGFNLNASRYRTLGFYVTSLASRTTMPIYTVLLLIVFAIMTEGS